MSPAAFPDSAGAPVAVERQHDPQAVERILRTLPAWFGIEEAIRGYVEFQALDWDGPTLVMIKKLR